MDVPRRVFLEGLGASSILPDSVFAGRSNGSDQFGVTEEEAQTRIENDQLRLGFDGDSGGLVEFLDKDSSRGYLSDGPYPPLSWKVDLYDEDYETLTAESGDAGTPSISTSSGDDAVHITLQWANPELSAPGADDEDADDGSIGEFAATIEVTATLRADDPTSYWTIDIQNDGDRAIKSVTCPYVANIEALSDQGDDAVFLPVRLGRKYQDPTSLDFSPVHRYPSGFGTMQFVTYVADGTGLYAAAEDPDGFAKQLTFESIGDAALAYEAAHLVPYRPGADFTLPYEMAFGLHSGGWQEAADRYREWVESEGWLSGVDSMVTDRVRNRGVSYHEMSYPRDESDISGDPISFETMSEMVSNIRELLGVPIGFRWWGWEEHGWPGNGDWFPPYEGREPFESILQSFQADGIDPLGFLNPTFILGLSDYWSSLEDPERIPIQARDGTLRKFYDNDLQFYKASPANPEWRTRYERALSQMVAAGYEQLELDGFPWMWVPDCWNDAHSHPLGKGGNWFPKRMRQLLRELHTTSDIQGGLNLGGEGIADFYLPYMNVHIIRDGSAEFYDPAVKDGSAEVVPMFPYAFGDYAATRTQKGHIGNFAVQRTLQQLFAGRSIEWGSIPVFMGHIEPTPAGYDQVLLEYYSRIGEARTGYANRFLARGEMHEKPDLPTGQVEIDQRGVQTTTPDIRGRGWRGEYGDLGLVLTNVDKRGHSRKLTIDLEDQPYELPGNPLLYVVKNGTYESVTGLDATVEIASSDVVLLGAIEHQDNVREALQRIEEAQMTAGADLTTLSEAKRAFDAHDFTGALEKADAAIEATTEQPTETTTATTEQTQQSSTRADEPTTSSVEQSPQTTATTSPGFLASTTVVGVLSAVGLSRLWSDDDVDGTE